MRNAVPIMAALAMAGCERPPPEPRVTVENAVVTLPAVPGRPGAAYFTLRTNNGRTLLTGISSPRIGRVELHESTSRGGMSGMRPLRDAAISPDAALVFEPGGRHAMLFDIDPAVRIGDRLSLTFRFDRAPSAVVDAEVRGPGGGHSGH